MADDYFQDITPNSGAGAPRASEGPTRESVEHREAAAGESESVPIRVATGPEVPTRGIRNIAPTRPPRPPRPPMPGAARGDPSLPRRSKTAGFTLWIAAGILLVVLAGLALLAFRPTTVTVTPKSHALVFTDAISFTAYPAETAATGTLTYNVQTTDLEDTDVVPSRGTMHAERKASGSITIFNNYSAAPVNLVKTTRFQTPDGLIFRVPADVTVPGKKGATPGQMSVTVIADQAGEKYNVGPVSKFTLPGLKSNSAMYAGVYARLSGTMSGGFVGDEPGTAPGAIDTARAAIRDRIESKARAGAARSQDVVIFPELMHITYASLPSTNESGGVRIHEKAHVETPTFSNGALAKAVAGSAAADADTMPVTLVPGKAFAAHPTAGAEPVLGGDPLQFRLSGQAELIWTVDTNALSTALAGRDQTAFQAIVNGFPSIEEAHARIEPFWKSSFPANASDIKITIVPPTSGQ